MQPRNDASCAPAKRIASVWVRLSGSKDADARVGAHPPPVDDAVASSDPYLVGYGFSNVSQHVAQLRALRLRVRTSLEGQPVNDNLQEATNPGRCVLRPQKIRPACENREIAAWLATGASS
jgi:hypothetical protein